MAESERFIVVQQARPTHFRVDNLERLGEVVNGEVVSVSIVPMVWEVIDRGERFVVGGRSNDLVLARCVNRYGAIRLVDLLSRGAE